MYNSIAATLDETDERCSSATDIKVFANEGALFFMTVFTDGKTFTEMG